MPTFALLLGLLAACVPLVMLADRLHLPSAVALIVGGMLLALVPGMPRLELDPELVLALFLPPLLQLSSYRTDWSNFRSNLRPILLLAIGAVFFTAAAIACVAKLLLPSLPWWAAVALGAIVAPPDAVSAAAVLRRLPLPKSLVGVLEGESLVNDASSLVLYRFAVAAAVAGVASFWMGAAQFAGAALGGALVGWLVGRVAMWVFARIDETVLDITVGLLASFAAYLAAEALHASGVLAAVACGWVLDRHQREAFSAQTRLESAAVWGFVEFLLTSLVFILIGLQLRGIFERLDRYSAMQLLAVGAGVSLTLIGSRLAWVMGTAGVERAVGVLRGGKRRPAVPARHLLIVSWAGMRGVVSLAAALALPAGFPARDLIVFAAFCAILSTLLVQGTTLGWLIQRLGVREEPHGQAQSGLADARVAIEGAALDAVKAQAAGQGEAADTEAAAGLLGEFENRAENARAAGQADSDPGEGHRARLRIRQAALEQARAQLGERKDSLDADAYASLLAELDLEERQIQNGLDA